MGSVWENIVCLLWAMIKNGYCLPMFLYLYCIYVLLSIYDRITKENERIRESEDCINKCFWFGYSINVSSR